VGENAADAKADAGPEQDSTQFNPTHAPDVKGTCRPNKKMRMKMTHPAAHQHEDQALIAFLALERSVQLGAKSTTSQS